MKLVLLLIISVLYSCTSSSDRKPASIEKNILIIGDSHMAGPFGQYLHQSIATLSGVNVISYGHSSSAPLHWLGSQSYKLSGGVYHALSANHTINPNEIIRLPNPNPTDWRVHVEVPKFEPLLTEMNLHSEWRGAGFPSVAPDIVVIELGANDRRAIMPNDRLNQTAYSSRLQFTKSLALLATQNGAQCLWIGPPHGKNKTNAQQEALYQMLTEALEDTPCQLVSSNHYKAMGCDGVHFNCRSEFSNARKWASEMAQKISELIN